ncbi:fungal pheromone mating factor STE2 GPCR-domain-containing protein [Hypoxylon crocopeplum]|nr:fungal pheromone mating factor STE2 GPCR-domain-containing protein [Hypoxylon crocopeplum]
MASDTPFDPRNQTFYILGRANSTETESQLIPISMPVIDAQRVRLANTSINYGVQLGLCLLSLLSTLLLLPSRKLRRAVHLTQTLCLVVSITRLALLVLYFPGPLTEYYVAWTRDASMLRPQDYYLSTASSALSVLQLALVETALALQTRVLVRTWGSCTSSLTRTTFPSPFSKPNTTGTTAKPTTAPEHRHSRACSWRPPVLILAVVLAAAAVGVRAVWVAHYTQALRGHTVPVPLDAVGEAAVTLGAASVFYFCGVFFAHLALHLAATRRVLRGRKRKMSITLTLKGGEDGGSGVGGGRGLTSLEILAVGNGVLMLVPCLFAGLDIAAGPGNARVLPFDAGSWVHTLVAAGLPLISIAAFYRGSDSADSRLNSRLARLRPAPSRRRSRRVRRLSSLLHGSGNAILPFRQHARPLSSQAGETDSTTLAGSSSDGGNGRGHVVAVKSTVVRPPSSWDRGSPTDMRDEDIEAMAGLEDSGETQGWRDVHTRFEDPIDRRE